MRRLKWLLAARADLIDIWIWSIEKWGEARADEYVAGFEFATDMLAAHPAIGVECSPIAQGLRRHMAGHHHVYYLDDGVELKIVRILHERMKADPHQFDE